MKALVFDKSKYDWETSRGFYLVDVPKPEIQNPDDVIIKVHYAGVCGSDKGIWYRTAFRDQILGSIDTGSNPLNPPYSKGDVTPLKVRGEGGVMKSYRIIGHEFFG
ncbi:MAG: hypothetical protein Q8R08_00450, partial [bacterium]|nr:hypothetical protein [bacterium]